MSLKAELFARLENAAERHDRSCCWLVEQALVAFLDGLCEPEVGRIEALALQERRRIERGDKTDFATGIREF